MSEHRTDYLVRPVRGTVVDGFLRFDGVMGIGVADTKVSMASEKTWQQIRKNIQEVAEKYLSEVDCGMD